MRTLFDPTGDTQAHDLSVRARRQVDILNPAPKVIEALTNTDLPSGVSIDVKMM